MDVEFVKHRNIVIKEYLEETDKTLWTEKDVLVSQIMEANQTECEYPSLVDLDALYDLELDEIIRQLEIHHSKMTVRIKIADYEHNKKHFLDWD